MNYAHEIEALIQKVTLAIGKPILKSKYEIVDRGLPHIPPTRLPDGKMAIYMFLLGDVFLKIGKANYRSNARFWITYHKLRTF